MAAVHPEKRTWPALAVNDEPVSIRVIRGPLEFQGQNILPGNKPLQGAGGHIHQVEILACRDPLT